MSGKDKFRVALVSPQVVASTSQIRRTQPPLGLGYLAAVLRESGFASPLILDAAIEGYEHVEKVADRQDLVKYGLSESLMAGKVREFDPALVGISCLFSSQADCSYSLAKKIKENLPRVPIVLGGIHASILGAQILKEHHEIDYVLSGEADFSFRDLALGICMNEDVRGIAGLVWRKSRDIMVNPRPPLIKNLDEIPFPAWDLMEMEEYFRIGMFHNPFVRSGRVGCIMTSRGCPQRCYYCSSSDFFGHGFRAISAGRVVTMIEHLVKNFAIKELQILDDNFTLDSGRVIEICEAIAKYGLRITLPNAIRADVPLDRKQRLKMFESLRRSGCEQIGIAVEHGDQEFLDKVIGKRLDLKEAVATCELAHKADLLVHCNFMTGFPFETAAQRQKTADFARNLPADSFSISLATPLPGTMMWDIVAENNLFLETFDVDRILYSEVSIKPLDISVEELRAFVKELNREINGIAAKRNPKSREKYKLFEHKNAHGDRKYQFSSEKKL